MSIDALAQEKAERTEIVVAGRCIAIISLPRLAFTDTMFCCLRVCERLDIPAAKCSGVYWGQSMQNLLTRAATGGWEYILTLDYDGLFVPQDVARLVWLMDTQPNYDALCGVQMGRDRLGVLMTLPDGVGEEVDGKELPGGCKEVLITPGMMAEEVLPLRSGHFGMTIFRASAFDGLPKPWFMHTPGPTGEWDLERRDDDMYFWDRWHDAGRKLGLANRVCVGHIQTVATWPDRTMQPLYQFLPDYDRHGKPAEAWE